MHWSKRIAVFVMILALGAPLLFSLIFMIEQQSIHFAMRNSLEKVSLQTISVEANKIIWVKKDKEIIIDGRLFDIKSVEIKGDLFVFTGLFDQDEDAINFKLSTLANQNNTDNKSRQNTLLLLLLAPFYHKEEAFSISLILNKKVNKIPGNSERIPTAPSYSLLRPPCA